MRERGLRVASSITCSNPLLIPLAWASHESPQQFYVYNPAITRVRDRLLMAYRVDSGRRETLQRRIAICVLDDEWRVIPGSAKPFSDTIRNGGDLHYDPRFFVANGRLFIHYNNNILTRPNQIHLVELDVDTLEAKTPARVLQLTGARQEIEKNWMMFEHDGDWFAVYQISPHTILKLDGSGSDSIECRRLFETNWDAAHYAKRYGIPCGGTPPIRRGQIYVSFFHSRTQVGMGRAVLKYWPSALINSLPRYPRAILRRIYWRIDQRRYYGGVYAFEAKPPFKPIWVSDEPVLRPEWERARECRRINPCASGIVYPAGAICLDDMHWLVSYGVHDERCCLRVVPCDPASTV